MYFFPPGGASVHFSFAFSFEGVFSPFAAFALFQRAAFGDQRSHERKSPFDAAKVRNLGQDP